jgi:hypothetical protein
MDYLLPVGKLNQFPVPTTQTVLQDAYLPTWVNCKDKLLHKLEGTKVLPVHRHISITRD